MLLKYNSTKPFVFVLIFKLPNCYFMKTLNYSRLFLLLALVSIETGLLSCENTNPALQSIETTAVNKPSIGRSARGNGVNDKVWNIAAKYYEELPEDQLVTVANEFDQLSAADLVLFFQYRTELDIAEIQAKRSTEFANFTTAEFDSLKSLLAYSGQKRTEVLANSLKLYNRPLNQLDLSQLEQAASPMDGDIRLERLSNIFDKSAHNTTGPPPTARATAGCPAKSFPYRSTKGSSRGGSYWYLHERIASSSHPNDCDHGYQFARDVANFYPRNGASVAICAYYKNRLARRSFRDSPTPTIHQELLVGNRAIWIFLNNRWSRFQITVGQIL